MSSLEAYKGLLMRIKWLADGNPNPEEFLRSVRRAFETDENGVMAGLIEPSKRNIVYDALVDEIRRLESRLPLSEPDYGWYRIGGETKRLKVSEADSNAVRVTCPECLYELTTGEAVPDGSIHECDEEGWSAENIDMRTLDGQMYDAVLTRLRKCFQSKGLRRMANDDFWRKEAARKITDAVGDRLDSLAIDPDSWPELFECPPD
jgi:hypothetical protein